MQQQRYSHSHLWNLSRTDPPDHASIIRPAVICAQLDAQAHPNN
jgi:hypothetical protein